MAIMTSIAWVVALYIFAGLKVINQYERGVRFTLGKYSGMMDPGLRVVLPVFQSWQRVDMRTKVADVPDQDAITKDNITVKVNAVMYYKVRSAEKAIIEVEEYNYAVSQLAQTTMRNVVGEVTLDELLAERKKNSDKIESIVDKATDPWGIDVEAVEIKDIGLSQELVRTMAKQAEAEREKRANIINSEGEVLAAQNLAKAARLLTDSPGALHLRTLNSINDMSSDQSNTVVFAVPLEILQGFQGILKKK
ncbi:hypothetical protein COY28_02540 [Candidatus Woesearchaeota archaeon CG_4_10_14_0_2_um_filter_57_5]|nr:MAG: hypothetical protein COY28_02540 [Candidatus Woesearchaeota archaeon CG_4_10_14_0_2_um_filter_57_5]